MIGLADQTKGAREKHRAGSKTLPIRFHACRDSVPGPGAFDHDLTHPVPPLLDFCAGGMWLRHRLERVLLTGERLFQPIPAGCKGLTEN